MAIRPRKRESNMLDWVLRKVIYVVDGFKNKIYFIPQVYEAMGWCKKKVS